MQSALFTQDKKLSEMEEWVHTQHKKINSTFEFQQLSSIKDVLKNMSTMKSEFERITRLVDQAYSDIYTKMSQRIDIFKKQLQIVGPTYDITTPNVDIDISTNTNTNANKDVELAPNILASNVITIELLDDLPNTKLYWVNSVQQFAFKINGVIIRGNIGTIYQSSHSSGRNITKVNPCRYGKMCRNVSTSEGCNYYHDPADMRHVPLEVKAREIRNYTNGSWLYTSDTYKDVNKMMRHIGSRPTLYSDIANVSTLEAAGWIDQSMHCLLITLALNQMQRLPKSTDHFDEKMRTELSLLLQPQQPRKKEPHIGTPTLVKHKPSRSKSTSKSAYNSPEAHSSYLSENPSLNTLNALDTL